MFYFIYRRTKQQVYNQTLGIIDLGNGIKSKRFKQDQHLRAKNGKKAEQIDSNETEIYFDKIENNEIQTIKIGIKKAKTILPPHKSGIHSIDSEWCTF